MQTPEHLRQLTKTGEPPSQQVGTGGLKRKGDGRASLEKSHSNGRAHGELGQHPSRAAACLMSKVPVCPVHCCYLRHIRGVRRAGHLAFHP